MEDEEIQAGNGKTLREVVDEYEDRRSEVSLKIREVAKKYAFLPDH